MTREAKVGLMMVAVLIGVFGFLVYKRIHRPAEALAEQRSLAEETDASPEADPVVSLEDDLLPRQKKQPSRIGRDVEQIERGAGKVVRGAEKAVAGAGKLAANAVDELNPFADESAPTEPPRRESLKLPAELPDENDFAFDEPVARPARQPVRQVSGIREEEFEAPRRDLAPPDRRDDAETDPFDDDTTPKVQPVEFNERPRRERDAPSPDEDNPREIDRNTRPAEIAEIEIDIEEAPPARPEPRPVRQEPRGFDNAHERRPAAPVGGLQSEREFNEELTFPEPSSRGTTRSVGETYVIQPNDNFWTISRKIYGAGRYYMALARHNQKVISDPRTMKPGVTISTPAAAVLEERYGELIPKAGPADPVATPAVSQSRKPAAEEQAGYFTGNDGLPMYRVSGRDTLTGIAKAHLGRTSRWVQILEMNRNVLRDGNELKIGTVLRLPADASRVQVVGHVREYR